MTEPRRRACASMREPNLPPPVIVAWGAGVDSTAMIIELAARRERIDMVLIADIVARHRR